MYSLFQDITIERAISSVCMICTIKYLIKLLIDEFYLKDNHTPQLYVSRATVKFLCYLFFYNIFSKNNK